MTQDISNPFAPLGSTRGRSAINEVFRIAIPASGIAQAPAIPVAHAATVRIAALITNAASINAAVYRDALKGTNSTDIAAGDEIIFPVDSTGQIFLAGTAGDIALVSVKAGN